MALTITAANSGTTLPLPANSFLIAPGAGGAAAGTLILNIGSTSSYTGHLAVGVVNDGVTLERIPDNTISPMVGGAKGIPAGVTGSFSIPISLAGQIYVYGLSDFSGTAVIPLLFASLGALEISGASGGLVTIGGPLGAHGGVAVEGVAAGTPIPLTGQSLTPFQANGSPKGLVHAGATTVKQFFGLNGQVTSAWLMLFDAVSDPGNGATPKDWVYVSFGLTTAYTQNGLQYDPDYVSYSTGVYYAWSSTAGTLTELASGTNLEVYVRTA